MIKNLYDEINERSRNLLRENPMCSIGRNVRKNGHNPNIYTKKLSGPDLSAFLLGYDELYDELYDEPIADCEYMKNLYNTIKNRIKSPEQSFYYNMDVLHPDFHNKYGFPISYIILDQDFSQYMPLKSYGGRSSAYITGINYGVRGFDRYIGDIYHINKIVATAPDGTECIIPDPDDVDARDDYNRGYDLGWKFYSDIKDLMYFNEGHFYGETSRGDYIDDNRPLFEHNEYNYKYDHTLSDYEQHLIYTLGYNKGVYDDINNENDYIQSVIDSAYGDKYYD